MAPGRNWSPRTPLSVHTFVAVLALCVHVTPVAGAGEAGAGGNFDGEVAWMLLPLLVGASALCVLYAAAPRWLAPKPGATGHAIEGEEEETRGEVDALLPALSNTPAIGGEGRSGGGGGGGGGGC